MNKKHLEIRRMELDYDEFVNRDRSLANSIIGEYIIFEQLARGAFGRVYIAKNTRLNQEVAVKVIDLRAICNEASKSRRQHLLRYAKTQAELMRMCDSKNVIKCYDVLESKDIKIIVLEYCNNGTLRNEIQMNERIPQKEAILIAKQLFNGIAELHSHNIIHRDLKPQNILQHNGVYKIADMGLSKQLEQNCEKVGTSLGTPGLIAPQVCWKQKYGLKADIWSIGIVLVNMIFGRIPFSRNQFDSQENIQSCIALLKSQCITFNGYTASKEISNFLRCLLSIKSQDRLGWAALQHHPIFSTIQAKSELLSQFRYNYKLVLPNNVDACQNINTKDMSKTIQQSVYCEQKALKLVFLASSDPRLKPMKQKTEEQIATAWVKQSNHECLKVELLLKEIIVPLSSFVKFEKRKYCEMMYLLITRCWNVMSLIYLQLKTFASQYIVESFHKTIHDLQSKVKKQWQKYSQMLKEQQDLTGSICFDAIQKLFNQKHHQKRDKFFVGIQKKDYTALEQITFTYENYILPFLNKQSVKKNFLISRVKKFLFRYKQICTVELQKNKKFNFPQFIAQINNDR